jgi:DeoR/GlpR family transcriptional regulator of sugar metabolism
MLNQRQNKILSQLSKADQVTVKSLSRELKVSAVTIRQDLNLMEAEGLLKRVHGGAVLKDADDLANRLGINYEKKLKIARKVATYVNEGETILIESGSINALLAREIAKKKNVRIITTNVFIARQFRKNEQANVILLGGLYQHQSETLVGKITKVCIDQINYTKAFIGIDGYTTRSGFTLRDLYRSEISSYIIERSKDVFIVTDSSKFGKTELTNVCYPSQVQHVATDKDLDPLFIQELRDAGVHLILA